MSVPAPDATRSESLLSEASAPEVPEPEASAPEVPEPEPEVPEPSPDEQAEAEAAYQRRLAWTYG